jgi:hypothetical protein
MKRDRNPNMTLTSQPSKRLMLAIAAVCLGSTAACNLADSRTINFDFTGQVLDFDTREPIEGAYALAVYDKVDLGFAASASYCVKTKGMVTGKDGRFNFPIDRLDGISPAKVVAIKADYYYRTFESVPTDVWRKNNKETYSNRNVYLKKQDAAKPEFLTAFRRCERPESREAVDAGIRYLELELVELKKYSKYPTDSYEDTIKQMQLTPNKPAASQR